MTSRYGRLFSSVADAYTYFATGVETMRHSGVDPIVFQPWRRCRCDYCGTLANDEDRVNCKQCGAPLRTENV